MFKSSQKGVSLYLAIVIMTALLAIVLGVTGILVNQIKMIRGMEDSVIAFFAADTGNEKGLQIAYGSSPEIPATDNGCLDINGNNACYEVSVNDATSDAANCAANYYCIKSIGSYRETKRAIETNI